MLSPLTYFVVLALVCAYAFYRGQAESRIAAVICVVASIASVIVMSPLAGRYSGLESGVMLVDLGVLIGFTVIALRSERFWPLWVAGLQLTTIIAHLFKVADLDLIPHVYAAAARFWVYPIFLIIVIGTWRSHQRARQERDDLALPG
jgi:nicotinamide riboside transporter PnuC